jgi:hypothetical protein
LSGISSTQIIDQCFSVDDGQDDVSDDKCEEQLHFDTAGKFGQPTKGNEKQIIQIEIKKDLDIFNSMLTNEPKRDFYFHLFLISSGNRLRNNEQFSIHTKWIQGSQ